MSTETTTNVTGQTERYLAFSLVKERYAVPLSKVKEVIGFTETTPVPYTPPYYKGIMNLRGQVISVIDLRMKFKMSKADVTPETAIIILDLNPVFLGIIVDSVDSVLALNSQEISPAPDVETTIKSEFLSGVARKDNQLVLLIDVESALNVDDLKAIKKSAGAKAA